ncbi:MAG TPA: hypothetical protein VN026_09670 [Bacteroidia bacterium]|jgi:hypothetical protein|nr:hypothetical protein [Bacteroidia bacterium]
MATTAGKVLDGVVILSAGAVVIGGAMTVFNGVKNAKYGILAMGALTALVGIYAIKEAVTKINA